MFRYEFLVNLRQETLAEAFRRGLEPRGYLVAPAYARGAVGAAAAQLRKGGVELMADNGNFSLIGLVAGRHRGAADAILARVRLEEAALGRRARSGDLTPELRADATALARLVRDDVASTQPDAVAALAAQAPLNPTRVVGVEDITMATWLSLDLEPDYLTFTRTDYRRRNEAVARAATEVITALPWQLRAGYYAVASAVSYNTAYDAGRVFGSAGLRRAAIGFGAYMADDHYIDHYLAGRRRHALPTLMPNRYLRTALVARGFMDGYRDAYPRWPLGLHCLGLGAPIMLPIVALAAGATDVVSFDATSPIRDAGEGTLYTSAPAYLKIRTRRAAQRLAADPAARWECPCQFCSTFASQRPFNYDEAVRRWAGLGREAVTAEDLRPGGPLHDSYPLLSEPSAGALRTEVNFARSGHNHWALHGIINDLNEHRGRSLRGFVERVTNDYVGRAGSDLFANAVMTAQTIAADGPP